MDAKEAKHRALAPSLRSTRHCTICSVYSIQEDGLHSLLRARTWELPGRLLSSPWGSGPRGRDPKVWVLGFPALKQRRFAAPARFEERSDGPSLQMLQKCTAGVAWMNAVID